MSETHSPSESQSLRADLAQRWASFVRFAATLAGEIKTMRRGGQRGFMQNIRILEGWVRAALLQLAEIVDLPTARPRRPAAKDGAAASPSPPSEPKPRRAGFRVLLPDAHERALAAVRPPVFDISQFAGHAAPRRDQRERYLQHLEAIGAVLQKPELYARRVKRKLEKRRKRAPLRHIPLKPQSALGDLLRAAPDSALGRYVRYNDSG